MHAVISDAAPSHTVEDRPLTTEAPETATAVRLHVDLLKADRISAHLEWRLPGAQWTMGETLSMDVMDAQLSDAMIERFLGSLWARSGINL